MKDNLVAFYGSIEVIGAEQKAYQQQQDPDQTCLVVGPKRPDAVDKMWVQQQPIFAC